MMRMRAMEAGLLGAVLLAAAFTGCLINGEDGESYLSLDWEYAPIRAYFPGIPSDVYIKGAFYEHGEGDFYGEYVAWDGHYYEFIYTIEINEGERGTLDSPGRDGADRYYFMELYSWGPELYYLNDAGSRALGLPAPPGGASAEQFRASALDLRPTRGTSVAAGPAGGPPDGPDASLYDREHPEPYLWQREGPGYRLRIEGRRYRPKDGS
jgi:hypothetical protein